MPSKGFTSADLKGRDTTSSILKERLRVNGVFSNSDLGVELWPNGIGMNDDVVAERVTIDRRPDAENAASSVSQLSPWNLEEIAQSITFTMIGSLDFMSKDSTIG